MSLEVTQACTHLHVEAAASNMAEGPVTTILCSRCVRTTYCWWMSSIGCQGRGLESTGGASRRRRRRWWMACPWWHNVPSRVQLHSNTSFVPRELEHTCGTPTQVHPAASAIRLRCACHVGCPSSVGTARPQVVFWGAAGSVHVFRLGRFQWQCGVDLVEPTKGDKDSVMCVWVTTS
jgi:hypothetical protein